jgi:hypothetical protein
MRECERDRFCCGCCCGWFVGLFPTGVDAPEDTVCTDDGLTSGNAEEELLANPTPPGNPSWDCFVCSCSEYVELDADRGREAIPPPPVPVGGGTLEPEKDDLCATFRRNR